MGINLIYLRTVLTHIYYFKPQNQIEYIILYHYLVKNTTQNNENTEWGCQVHAIYNGIFKESQ